RVTIPSVSSALHYCTLSPMLAIPIRVVCLLGMNDGDYPRAQPPLDFDLMGGDYRPGDRSRREDDRYLLLEAVLSAREQLYVSWVGRTLRPTQLYVSWVGRSVRDNSEKPPSVLIGQLRDHLAAGWRLAGREGDGEALLEALTCEHPLQPFSAAYFRADSRLFSYAGEWLAAHQEAEEQQAPAATEPPKLDEPIELKVLQEFLRNPVRQFHQRRLKLYLEEMDTPLADEEHFEVDHLQNYSLRQELLQAALAEPDPDVAPQRL